MQNRDGLFDWSIPCATWFGVRVRLSPLFLIVGAVLALQTDDFRVGLIFALCLLASALLRQLAYVLAVRLTGGSTTDLLIWPLGGLSRGSGHASPSAPIATAAAGPMMNLAVCCLCLPFLTRGEGGWAILNPFEFPAVDLDVRFSQTLLAYLFLANWILVVANLLPASPLDAGVALDAVLTSRLGKNLGSQMASRVGMAVGGVAVIAALIIPSVWLCAIGALLLAYNLRESLRQQLSESFDDSFMGYDFSQGYTSLERSVPTDTAVQVSLLQRWLARRRLAREERQRLRSEEAERELDILLAKVHTYGINSLTDSERRTLKRASARYRGRSKS